MDTTTPTDGFSNVDFIRRRWAAMGLDRTEADVQAAAKAMDEEDARVLKTQAPAESPDDEIEDAWNQDRCATSRTDQLNEVQQRETQQPAASDELDDVFQRIRDEFAEVQQPTEQEPTPQPAGRTAAEAAVEEAISSSSNQNEVNPVCPGYIINNRVSNCKAIRTDKELHCIGLLNFLMRKHGYAYVTNEQLAKWLRMENPESVRHLLARLVKRELICNIGSRHGQVRWVVRQDLRDPRRGEV